MKRSLGLLVTLLIAVSGVMAQNRPEEKKPAPAPKITYIRAGRLFDSTSENLRSNVVIVVQDDRIQKVVAAGEANIPAGAAVVDLSNATVLPGLIDCHTHYRAAALRSFRRDLYLQRHAIR